MIDILVYYYPIKTADRIAVAAFRILGNTSNKDNYFFSNKIPPYEVPDKLFMVESSLELPLIMFNIPNYKITMRPYDRVLLCG